MFAQESVMDVQKIKELALANGFSLKEQASGNMDLHSYVYEFANAVEQAVKSQAVLEWIETAIQPPEEGQKVIISGIYGVGIAEFSYLYKDEFVMYDMGASNPILSKDQVKFWMPLPDAPQEPAHD